MRNLIIYLFLFISLYGYSQDTKEKPTNDFMKGRRHFGSVMYAPFQKDYLSFNFNITVGAMLSKRLAFGMDYHLTTKGNSERYIESFSFTQNLDRSTYSVGWFSRYYFYKGLFGSLGLKYHVFAKEDIEKFKNLTPLLDNNGSPVLNDDGTLVYTWVYRKDVFELTNELWESYFGIGYSQRIIDGLAIDVMPTISLLRGQRQYLSQQEYKADDGNIDYYYDIIDDKSYSEWLANLQFRIIYFF